MRPGEGGEAGNGFLKGSQKHLFGLCRGFVGKGKRSIFTKNKEIIANEKG